MEKYLQLLVAGGSDWPHVLLAKLGIDLKNPQFWQEGLSAIEQLITRAEKLAEEVDSKQLTADN